MHDYLDILGLPNDAPASEVRRRCARRIPRPHPDFREGDAGTALSAAWIGAARASAETDVAIDFADIASFVDRMQAAFFADARP